MNRIEWDTRIADVPQCYNPPISGGGHTPEQRESITGVAIAEEMEKHDTHNFECLRTRVRGVHRGAGKVLRVISGSWRVDRPGKAAGALRTGHLRGRSRATMIVVSDMMGTLTTGSPVLGLVDWVRHHQSRWQAELYMASITPGYLMARRGWIDWQAWGQGLMIKSLSMVRQATPEKMKQVGEWAVEHNLWKKRREDVVARLRTHGEQNARVYIASSVVEPLIEPFARRIGAETIGTPVQYRDGRVRVAGDLVAQERKIGQVLSKLGVQRVDWAYGDTWMDIPLLEHAEHPVAVYPDARLRAAALERGWEILGDTPSYP